MIALPSYGVEITNEADDHWTIISYDGSTKAFPFYDTGEIPHTFDSIICCILQTKNDKHGNNLYTVFYQFEGLTPKTSIKIKADYKIVITTDGNVTIKFKHDENGQLQPLGQDKFDIIQLEPVIETQDSSAHIQSEPNNGCCCSTLIKSLFCWCC